MPDELYIDPILAVGLSLAAGALLRRHPAEVLAVFAGAWTLCASRLKKKRRGWARAVTLMVLSVLGLGLGWLRAGRAVAEHEAVLARVDEDAPGIQRCAGTARVVSSPSVQRETLRWTGEVREMTCGERVVRAPFLATFYDPDRSSCARGDEVAFVAQLGPPERLTNFDTPDPVPLEARRGAVRSGGLLAVRIVSRGWGPLAWIDRARAASRARIEETFPADTAPMARAMMLGENDLAPEDDAAFRGSGLAHLLAVSGMHLVLVVLGFTRVLRVLLIRVEALAARTDASRVADALGIAGSFLYADFAGSSGSALRAAWMTSAVLLARLLGRRGDGVRSLGLSIVGMASMDPLIAHDVSFVLSVLATSGLFVFTPSIRAAVRLPGWLAQPLATTLGATMACAPITALLAPALPLGSVLANLLAVPLGEMVSLPLCLLHGILAPLPSAERGSAMVASFALSGVRGIARAASYPGWLSMRVPPPTDGQLTVLSALLVVWMLARRWRAALVFAGVAGLMALEWRARAEGAPVGVLRVTFLDVGQGDAALIDLPDGQAMMVDAGGIVGSPVDVGARVVAPTLRMRRRDALSWVVLSHPHPDHFGGFASGLDGIAVRALWDTGQGEREGMGGGYAGLLAMARAKGAALERPSSLCGRHILSGVTVEILAPCPGPTSDRGPNDNSFVLRLGYGERHILLTGDAEHEEEGDLLHLPPGALRADVLKVGHHGSRTSSSPAFIAKIAPEDAVISVGARNRFGHPAAVTLDTLQHAGVRVFRTDTDGAVSATTDGHALSVERAVVPRAP